MTNDMAGRVISSYYAILAYHITVLFSTRFGCKILMRLNNWDYKFNEIKELLHLSIE